ncbi:MAG: hypothetical protein ACREVO_04250 [Steroidobacteraceae bacterium]
MLRSSSQHAEIAQTVLYFLGWGSACQWGAYWAVDDVQRRLRPIVVWNPSSLDSLPFGCDLRRRPRRLSRVGLQSAVWFAVQTCTTVYGVIELRCQAADSDPPENLAAFERLGFHLGSAIEELLYNRARLH